jgi:hypothetical protein
LKALGKNQLTVSVRPCPFSQSLPLVELRQSMALAEGQAQRYRVLIARMSRFVSEDHQKSTLKLRILIPKSKMNKTEIFLYFTKDTLYGVGILWPVFLSCSEPKPEFIIH